MAPSRHHHPDPLPLSFSPLNHPIWSCMGEFCWRLWVAQASNGLSLFCRHDLAIPVGVEIFFGCGCLVGIEFRDLFQFEFLLIILLLGGLLGWDQGSKPSAVPGHWLLWLFLKSSGL
uniref:Uncharacterized protein n=1 Tax=Fagus sylvatica TaxID=28930 RepID=A0A2N9I7N2_FAGSY